jgi:hypothetical protein
MSRLAVTCATVIAVALGCAQSADAQTQMQGKTMGSQVPEPGAPPKPSPKAKRAECVSQGESQGLKGKDLKKVRERVHEQDRVVGFSAIAKLPAPLRQN